MTGPGRTLWPWPALLLPRGHDHWTLRALAGKVVELGLVESLPHEAVRLHLKKAPSSRGRRNSGAFPR